MKLNKDFVAAIIFTVWFLSNLLSYYFFKNNGLIISNLSFMIILGSFVLYKHFK